jgi:hypothetical protein
MPVAVFEGPLSRRLGSPVVAEDVVQGEPSSKLREAEIREFSMLA